MDPRVAADPNSATKTDARPYQVCFFFNAQRHQILHGIATARALACDPSFQVTIVSPAKGHVDYARELVERLGGAPITFVHTRSRLLSAGMRRTGSVIPPKLLSLSVLATWLDGFDAIALPERTSMLLKRFGVRRPRFIHLDHGAGDRAAGFDRRIRQFDFVLMAGPKHRERLMGERLITPQAHAVVGYPKFEAADAIRDGDWRPFDNDLPTVLYNPHFSDLGSWKTCGAQVLEAFAAQDRYNLIVAPHVRLLDSKGARERWEPVLKEFAGHPRILIDRGSDRAIDMTYTTFADVYLGDVSSQVYEFLRFPRPCLFLNPHSVSWKSDENYAHWHLGPVVEGADQLLAAVDHARAGHSDYRARQEEAVARTFLPAGGASAAASAISTYLREQAPPQQQARPQFRAPAAPWSRGIPGLQSLRRAALAIPILAGGWLLHEMLEPGPTQAASNSFVERAAASHRTTLLRLQMNSQIESVGYDPAERHRATGISMPHLPKGWTVGDAQLYPSTRGDIVQVFLTSPTADRISLVGMRIDTPAGTKPVLETLFSERVAYWESGDLAFALVGRVPAARLLQLAAEIANEPAGSGPKAGRD